MAKKRLFRPTEIDLLEPRYLLTGTVTIPGQLPVALDQPHINALLQGPGGPVTAGDGSGFNIVGNVATGFSGAILSAQTASRFNLPKLLFNGATVGYNDAMAQNQAFNISNLYNVNLAAYPVADTSNSSNYTAAFGPLSFELGTQSTDALSANVFGAPLIDGKVVVIDPTPLFNNPLGSLSTYLYDPGAAFNSATASTNPGIPPTSLQVQTTAAAFSGYSSEAPNGAPPPSTGSVPLIGPGSSQPTPPVALGFGQAHTTANLLFNTAARSSFVSQATAAKVGVHYRPATYNSSRPLLVDANNVAIPNQFTVQLEAMGQSVHVAGFFLDTLALQTTQGSQIKFVSAPVLVADISLENPATGQNVTIDGELGMNLLIPSETTDGSRVSSGPFRWITYDSTSGLLGLEPTQPANSASILSRQVFYNNSVFDGFNPGINTSGAANDQAAIATDKDALLPGQTATFANYTSYTRGINGLMIDIAGVSDITAITAADFTFSVGNNSDPTTWQTLSVSPTVKGLPGAADFGSGDRIELVWPANTITNEWLQVTVLANAHTSLAQPDVFYFGNSPGETGNNSVDARVETGDVLGARGHLTITPVDVTNRWDFNRDGAVSGADVLAAARSASSSATVLNLITVPGSPPPGAPGLSLGASGDVSPAAATVYEMPAATLNAATSLKPAASLPTNLRNSRPVQVSVLTYASAGPRDIDRSQFQMPAPIALPQPTLHVSDLARHIELAIPRNSPYRIEWFEPGAHRSQFHEVSGIVAPVVKTIGFGVE